jgi:chromatin segregation and condensation protein Rec8/ScpA/Scc1 (kleisin family)
VVTFIAMLELLKTHLIDVVQTKAYAAIYLRPATASKENIDTYSDKETP